MELINRWRFGTLLGARPKPGVGVKDAAEEDARGLSSLVSHPSTRLGTPVIDVAGLSKTFPGASEPAVDNLSFAVNEGEVLAILGPSGCGKTTTLRCIAGFETPDGGEIHFRDRAVSSGTVWVPPEKRGLGMVFQQFALFPHLTVLENVTYGLMKMPAEEKRRRAMALLDIVGMADFTHRFPHQLSGGQQQRVALARALAPRPLVLLMDEPFGSLGADMRAQMRRDVKEILDRLGTTAILVTHDQEEAFLLAGRILILDNGRLRQLNTPDNIYHRPTSRFVARFVGLADFLPARLHPDAQAQAQAVETELGTFLYEGIPPEGSVDLLVRPDDIDIALDPQGSGLIVGREFKGADNMYNVRLPSGQIVRCVQPSEPVFQIGERVQVKAALRHVILFSREDH